MKTKNKSTHPKSVEMRFLRDYTGGNVKFKKGQIVKVSTAGNHHLGYVKIGAAEIVEEPPKRQDQPKEIDTFEANIDNKKYVRFLEKMSYEDRGLGEVFFQKKGSKMPIGNVEITFGVTPQKLVDDGKAIYVNQRGQPLDDLNNEIKEGDKEGTPKKKLKHPKKAQSEEQKENTKKEIKMEPIVNDGTPEWLCIKNEEVFPVIPGRTAEQSIKEPLNPEIKTTFKIKKAGLWQCRKCGATIQSDGKPYHCTECERETTFENITKNINPDIWKLPKWEDIPVDELDMLGLYDDMLVLIKRLLIFSEEIEYKIYALWIISTWKLECWDTVGFPIFIGLADSGKSRALRIISEMGYRVLKATGVKEAAIPRLCHYWNTTILIDEAHNKLNPNKPSGSGLLDFVKDSYKRGSTYVTCDNDRQDNVFVTKNFGFKAFAGEKSFNAGLLTRGLVFWMDKADPEIAKLGYVSDEFVKFRTRLLNYRYKTSDPDDLGNDFCLKGRTREIFESIIATGNHIGVDVEDVIEYAKKRLQKEEEILQGTIQYEILEIIKKYEENPTLDDAPDKVKTEDILESLGWYTGDKKEDNSNRQRIGYILRNMGIETKRTRDGRCIFHRENETRLRKLYARYKL